MPTKEEVKSAYRNLKSTIKAISEDENIPSWRKQPLFEEFADKLRKDVIQKYEIWLKAK